jgi:hypothetical protein
LIPDIHSDMARLSRLLVCLRLFVRSHFSSSSTVERPALFGLPLDIFLMLFDQLPLQSKIFLSQTCRHMRRQLRETCFMEINKLNAVNRACLLAELASSVLDRYSCPTCEKWHIIDRTDIPSPNLLSYGSSYNRCQTYSAATLPNRIYVNDFGLRYEVNPIHVHFALKLYHSCRVSDEDRLYLRKLMSPYETTKSLNLLNVKYKAWPRIIARKFLLHSTWHFKEKDRRFDWEDFPYLEICPHLKVQRSTGVPHNALVAAIAMAFTTSTLQSASCDCCLTDFEIRFQDGQTTILVWQNLGSGGSPWSLEWRSQTMEPAESMESGRYPWKLEGRIQDITTTYRYLISRSLSHVPGSVKTMYCSFPGQ